MTAPKRPTLVFSTVGGEQTAEVFEAEDQPRAIVLIAPALGVKAAYYGKMCQLLAKAGMTGLAVDMPGLGLSPTRASKRDDWGYPDLIDHYRTACLAAHAAYPRLPVIVLGHSIGGQVALMVAGQSVPGLAGVVLVASGSPHWRAWEGASAWGVRGFMATAGWLGKVWGHFPGDYIGFGGRQPKTLMKQWSHVGATGRFDFGDGQGEALLAQPGPPTRSIYLVGDRLATEASVRALTSKLIERQVEVEAWADPPHSGDHNRWPRSADHVVGRVADFLRTASGPGMSSADAI